MNLLHLVMSHCNETIKPMLRNMHVEFAPAARLNRRQMVGQIVIQIDALNGYRSMLLLFQNNVRAVQPRRLRKVAAAVDVYVTSIIADVDTAVKMLQAI